MTAPALPTTSSTTSPAVGLLRLDGVLCAAMGLTLAIGAEPVAELLGTASTGVLRVVGVALVLYGLDLVLLAPTRWARGVLRAAGIGNLAWEVASLAVAALADLSTTGRVLVAVQGLVVGALGLVQLRAARG
ncbi:MAG TPA: hypothetical protein VFR07_09520 [Mycobacteriales bacterium]|jgi:hypothetical protein|nr:hypothetical protein [Mycobacteriales bacterium]